MPLFKITLTFSDMDVGEKGPLSFKISKLKQREKERELSHWCLVAYQEKAS